MKSSGKSSHYSAIVWLFIPIWIVLMIAAIEIGLTSWMSPVLDTELSNWIARIVYLIPIALISLMMTWRMSLRQFTISNQEPKISKFGRVVLSILLTTIILAVSLYLLVVASIFFATIN